jgi:DnaK suppressor protein
MDNFLKKQEKKLKELRQQIEQQLVSFAKKDKKIKENWRSNFPEFNGTETGGSRLEVAQDEVEEYLNRLPVEYILELKLRDINLALEKIKKGTYGNCEKCKKKIPKKRLEAQPEARFCLKCKK